MGIRFIIILLIPIWILLESCSVKVAESGPASETTNGFSGVITQGEEPAEGVIVTLYAKGFNPVLDDVSDSLTLITNSRGEYFFAGVDPGSYNIMAIHPENRTLTLVQDIEMPENKDTIVTIPSAMLEMAGTITLHFEELIIEEMGHLFIQGTGINIEITADDINQGFIVVNDIPPADYTGIYYAGPDVDSTTNILGDGLNLQAGEDIVAGPYNNWKDTASIFINTSSTGADLMSDVYNFPLLVRLDNTNFNFTEAQVDGGDLRFTKSDGFSPISFEIERWDSGSQQAEIWIRLDTIFANQKSQFIYIYSGNSTSTTKSSGFQVFGPNYDFAGVWHISEESPDTTSDNLYQNSVENANHGDDRINSTDTEGLIGTGHYFTESDYIRVESPTSRLEPASGLTLSSWIKVDSNDTHRGTIATMKIAFGMRLNLDGGFLAFIDNEGVNIPTATDSTDGINLKDNIWHHLASTYDGSFLKIYLDGVEIKSMAINGNIDYSATHHPADPNGSIRPFFMIGKAGASGPSYWFEGHMDEIRVSGISRTPAWIKLNYESQKPGSSVLEINN